MKKLFLILLSIFTLSTASFAQTSSDAYQLSKSQNFGTARYNALSGAFGALGGDLTAIGNNPAGSAVFNNSFGSVTLSQGGSVYRTNYFGTVSETKEANGNFNQIGGVLVLKDTSGDSSIKKITLAANYNLENDYRDEYNIVGDANGTIGSYFVEQATGIPTGLLRRRDDEVQYTDAYIRAGERFGAAGQEALLGFSAIAISPLDDNNDQQTGYFSESNSVTNFQDTKVTTNGTSSKFTLNLGMELESNLYLGANVNIHNVDRRKNISFIEENNHARLGYEIKERTFGSGVSIGLGAIFKTSENIRIGASYQTPTWHQMIHEVDRFISSNFAEDISINGEDVRSRSVDPNIVFEYPEYSFRTPGKLSGSIAFVFGKKGLLSAEYERQDFSKTKYGNSFSGSSIINQNIENNFQATNTFKVGGEYRSRNWRFRGGGHYTSSPYKNADLEGDNGGYSLGIGYDWGKWKLDIGYNHFQTDINESLFENKQYSNLAFIERKGDLVSATLGVNF